MSDLEDFESWIEDLMEQERFLDELERIGSESRGCNLCDTDPQKNGLSKTMDAGVIMNNDACADLR